MTAPSVGSVLLADHTGTLDAAVSACGAVLVGRDVPEVLRVARAQRPAAVVVHVEFPPEGGISLLTRLAPLGLPTVLAVEDADVALLGAALRSGARTVVGVQAAAGRMERALGAAVRGDLFLGPELARQITALIAEDAGDPHPFPQLSVRERDVLAQLAAGVDPSRIAARLGVSPKTVRNQLARIQSKLGAQDRSQAALMARGAGLGQRRVRSGHAA